MGKNRLHTAWFFPPKDLVYFWLKTRHHSKAQTFFSKDNFPAKRLQHNTPFQNADLSFQNNFPRKKTCILFDLNTRHHLKAQTLLPRIMFPPKDIFFSTWFQTRKSNFFINKRVRLLWTKFKAPFKSAVIYIKRSTRYVYSFIQRAKFHLNW